MEGRSINVCMFSLAEEKHFFFLFYALSKNVIAKKTEFNHG